MAETKIPQTLAKEEVPPAPRQAVGSHQGIWEPQVFLGSGHIPPISASIIT